MLNSKYPSITELTGLFEISYRQGQRDIEYMRDSLGAPITYSAKQKGYFYSEDFLMPTMYLTADEAVYVKKLAEYYNQLNDMGLDEHKKYGEMFGRISSNFPHRQENDTQLQVPYTAKIIMDGRHSYRLLDRFLRGRTGDSFVYEFHNVELFIGLLLSCGSGFKIVHPSWLKEHVLRICSNVINNNQ